MCNCLRPRRWPRSAGPLHAPRLAPRIVDYTPHSLSSAPRYGAHSAEAWSAPTRSTAPRATCARRACHPVTTHITVTTPLPQPSFTRGPVAACSPAASSRGDCMHPCPVDTPCHIYTRAALDKPNAYFYLAAGAQRHQTGCAPAHRGTPAPAGSTDGWLPRMRPRAPSHASRCLRVHVADANDGAGKLAHDMEPSENQPELEWVERVLRGREMPARPTRTLVVYGILAPGCSSPLRDESEASGPLGRLTPERLRDSNCDGPLREKTELLHALRPVGVSVELGRRGRAHFVRPVFGLPGRPGTSRSSDTRRWRYRRRSSVNESACGMCGWGIGGATAGGSGDRGREGVPPRSVGVELPLCVRNAAYAALSSAATSAAVGRSKTWFDRHACTRAACAQATSRR